MAQDAMNQMKFDKNLEKDIDKASTYDDLMGLLHNAIERSPELGITRDPVTGQFVAREKEAPAAAAKTTAEETAREFKQTVKINGRDFDFVASSAEALELQVSSAKNVAQVLTADAAVTPRSARRAASQTPEEIAIARSEAEIEFRQGKLTTTEYLERTGAVGEYLADKGVDVDALATQQSHQAWESASDVFRNSPAGADWPGGVKNRQLLGDKLIALGLVDATDKVAALAKAFNALKAQGTLFDGDHTPEELNALTASATPQEIVQAWKESHDLKNGDATQANQKFIETFRRGRSSGLFGK